MPEAARLHDEVSHSDEGMFMKIGAAVGAVVGAAMVAGEVIAEVSTFFTGVSEVALGATILTASTQVAGATSLGMFIGKTLGSYFHHSSGEIKSAASTVFIGGQPAARGQVDVAKCNDHDGAEVSQSTPPQTGRRIAEGSETVYIEAFHAARKGDKGTCLYRITGGCGTVIIGGAKVLLVDASEMATSETPILDKVMLGLGLASGAAALKQAFGKGIVEGFAATLKIVGVAGVSWEAGEVAKQWAGDKWGEGSEQQEQATLTAQLGAGVLMHLGLNSRGGNNMVNATAARMAAEGAAARDAMASIAAEMGRSLQGPQLVPELVGGGRLPVPAGSTYGVPPESESPPVVMMSSTGGRGSSGTSGASSTPHPDAALSSAGDPAATFRYNQDRIAKALAAGNPESANGYEIENKIITEKGSDVVKAGEKVSYINTSGKTLSTDIDVETNSEVIQIKSGRGMPSPGQMEATQLHADAAGGKPIRVMYNADKVPGPAVRDFQRRYPNAILEERRDF